MKWSKVSLDNLPPFDKLLMIGMFTKEEWSAETGYFKGYTEKGFMFAKKLDKHNLNFEDVFMGHTHEFTGTHFFVVEIPEDAVWTKTKST